MRKRPLLTRPTTPVVAAGIAVAALVAGPVAQAKPLVGGHGGSSGDTASSLSTASTGVSWDDLLAGLALGALVALLALRAAKALRGRAAPVSA